MTNPRLVSLSVTYLLGLLALGTAACTTQVISGNGGNGSGGAATTGTQGQGGYMITAPCTNCGGPDAIALTAAQLFSSSSSSGQTGGTGSGGGPDPSTLYLELGNPAPTCAAPTPTVDCNAGSYDVSIGIPSALQQVGMINLGDPTLISTFGETSPGGGSDCSGSGGSFTEGTLQILSIDGQQVQFQLSGTMSLDFGFPSVDGMYTAPRCP